MQNNRQAGQVYEPAEDSQILAAATERYAFGAALDMGTGSGIQAIAAAKKKEVKSVVAADVNDDALKHAAANAEKEKVADKITLVKSSLFSNINGRFDTIIFNPPYLPQDKGIVDESIYGGRHGYELLEKFINSCCNHLTDNGIILIVFSSRTNKQKVDESIERNCMDFEEVGQKRVFFETLYAYKIKKSPLLLQLQEKGIKSVTLLEKGNRGVIYKAEYIGKTVAVKAKLGQSRAVAAIENEANWLRRLNEEKVGPRLLLAEKEWLAYWFVEGEFILDYLAKCGEKEAADVIKQMLQQARKLDVMGINKEEMLRQQGHAIVGKGGKVTLIDFERCHKTQKPKNVTQLCQFLSGGYVKAILRQKGIAISREKLVSAAKDYKNSQSEENFKKIAAAAGLQ